MTESTESTEQAESGVEALGDAGKRALDRMKQERNEARTALQAFQQIGLPADDLARLVKEHAEQDTEAAIAQARRETEQQVRGQFHARVRALAVRSAAVERGFLRPDDAALFLGAEIEQIPVSDDGEVDADAVNAALDKVVAERDYLTQKEPESQKFTLLDVGLVEGGGNPSALNGDGIEDALKAALGIA